MHCASFIFTVHSHITKFWYAGQPREISQLSSHMLDGELKLSDTENSCDSRSVTQSSSTAVTLPMQPSHINSAAPDSAPSSRVVETSTTGPTDPSAPFPDIIFSLPESQQPAPTPHSVFHGLEPASDSYPEHLPPLPTPRRPLKSAYGHSSTPHESESHAETSHTPSDAIGTVPSDHHASKELFHTARVRLSRESCFSGDTVVSMYGSSTQESHCGSSSHSSSDSGPFSVIDALQRTLSTRASRRSNSPRTGTADDSVAAGIHTHAGYESGTHDEGSTDNSPPLPNDRPFRVTEMVIGREIQVMVRETDGAAVGSNVCDPPTHPLSPRGDHCVRNSSMAHDTIRETHLQKDPEHTYTVLRPGSTHAAGKASGATVMELKQLDYVAHDAKQHPRSISPFSVGRVTYAPVGDAHDSMLSGVSESSMWSLSSPERSFEASGRTGRSGDGLAAPSVQPDDSSSDARSLQGMRSASRTYYEQSIGEYGPSTARCDIATDSLDQSAPVFVRGYERSQSAVAVHSFSGWNTAVAGKVSQDSATSCDIYIAPRESTSGVPDVQQQTVPTAEVAEAVVAPSATKQPEPLPYVGVAVHDSTADVSALAGGKPSPHTASPVLPVPPHASQLALSHGCAPLRDLQPGVADTLLPVALQDNATQHLASNLGYQKNEGEVVWSDVEVAWATACDVTTQACSPQIHSVCSFF